VGGERLSAATLDATGVIGDRQYALIDRATGLPAAPEKDLRWRKALYLKARSVAGSLPVISFPNGESCSLNDPSLNEALSDYFGFATATAANPHIEGHTDFPLTNYRHPHFPVHLVTTTTLKHLARLNRTETIDVRRFRPTVLIETGESDCFLEQGFLEQGFLEQGFLEHEWIGQRFRLGAVDLTVQEETKRCGMIFIAQPGLEDDPEILRNILRYNKRNLGIYCSVECAGTIHVGDRMVMPAFGPSKAATSSFRIGSS